MLSDEEIRRRYGDEAVISRRRGVVLVHLDHPDQALVNERTEEFDPDEFFEPECPLCQLQRSQGVVVFDDYGDDFEEEILLE